MVAPAGRLRRILLAVDGSDASDRAVAQLLAMRSELRDPSTLELHLLNVQPPVPGDVSSFVTKTSLQEYHQERGDAALTRARERLRAAGQPFTEHQRVGQPGAVIADLARNEHCDLVVMGTRGQGQVSGAILGSVAQSAIELGQVPVLLVK